MADAGFGSFLVKKCIEEVMTLHEEGSVCKLVRQECTYYLEQLVHCCS